jgi:hypothetical protein
MGIIKWWNDKWNKPEEDIQDKPELSDEVRVSKYMDGGGIVVDLSNKPRMKDDGFVPDHELIQPFNEAHTGTKAGLNSMIRGKR